MERWGFEPVRSFLNLEKDQSDRAEAELPATVKLGCFSPGEEVLLAEIQNRTFAGTWGFCPNSPEEIKFYLDFTDCRLEDILMVRSKKENKVVGYCWPHLLERGGTNQCLIHGRIHMCGVDPAYQGQGLGKALLCRGLSDLVAKGVRSVEITVDRENRFALSLYKSLGFKKISTNTWFEKIV
jgi:mycothiol synthase